MSSWLIYENDTKCQGLICLGALFAPGVKPKPKMPLAVLVGESDPNLREMRAIEERLKDFDAPQHYESFPGGHVIAPAALLQKAVDWHEARWAEQFGGDGKDAAKLGGTYRKLATKYAGTPSAEVAQERLLALGASVK